MYKVIITDEMKNLHLNYFKDEIIPQIKKAFDIFKESDPLNSLHNRFIEYCLKQDVTECLAIGTPEELQRLDVDMKRYINIVETAMKNKNFSMKTLSEYLESTKNIRGIILKESAPSLNLGTNGEITYSQVILNLFGYKKFSTTPSYYDLIEQTVKNKLHKSNYGSKVQEGIIEKLENEYNLDLIKLKQEGYQAKNDFKSKVSKIIDQNITLGNYKQYRELFKTWNPYTFIFMSNLRTCPYCNHQYITPVFSNDGRVRADLDHFLPKSIYPYFSMSLYNLIPTCKFCNSSLKRDKVFTFKDIHPYRESINDYLYFEADLINPEYPITVKSRNPNDLEAVKKVNQYNQVFKLDALYSYHRNQVKELLLKRSIYPEAYIHDLYENNKELFNSENEVRELIIGYLPKEEDINKEPLAKFRRDIAEQLMLKKSKVKLDSTLLKQLKYLIK